MKMKLAIPDEELGTVQHFLEEHGIEISENADYILTKKEPEDSLPKHRQYAEYLSAKKSENGDKALVAVSEILYLESFGHQIEIVTEACTFYSADPLYRLMEELHPVKFVRINKSTIIAKHRVKQIKPSFSRKFTLVMSDGKQLEVTRSYYDSFRNAFHI